MTVGMRSETVTLASVFLGAQFVFRTVEILGPEYASLRKPPYEGQALTVVGFRPHLKNNVVVRDRKGNVSLMPLRMVEKALSSKSLQIETDEALSRLRQSPERGNVGTSVQYKPEAAGQLIESCRCSPAEQRQPSGKAVRARPAQRGGHQNGC